MYRFPEKQVPLFVDFYLPFGGRLRADNHWVKLSSVIPWDAIVDSLLMNPQAGNLRSKQQKELAVIRELYCQQKRMHERKEHQIDDRIVSISQPHVRPIVREKTKAETGFGAKGEWICVHCAVKLG